MHQPIGKILVAQQLINQDDLEAILAQQHRTGKRFGQLLVERSVLDKIEINLERIVTMLLMLGVVVLFLVIVVSASFQFAPYRQRGHGGNGEEAWGFSFSAFPARLLQTTAPPRKQWRLRSAASRCQAKGVR
jgi:hypothetical protein